MPVLSALSLYFLHSYPMCMCAVTAFESLETDNALSVLFRIGRQKEGRVLVSGGGNAHLSHITISTARYLCFLKGRTTLKKN